MRLAADASEELSSAFPMPLVPPGGDVGHLHVSLSPLMAARTLAESTSPCRAFLISFSLNRKPSSRPPPPFQSKRFGICPVMFLLRNEQRDLGERGRGIVVHLGNRWNGNSVDLQLAPDCCLTFLVPGAPALPSPPSSSRLNLPDAAWM